LAFVGAPTLDDGYSSITMTEILLDYRPWPTPAKVKSMVRWLAASSKTTGTTRFRYGTEVKPVLVVPQAVQASTYRFVAIGKSSRLLRRADGTGNPPAQERSA
jgi:hypothetical protein